METNIAPGLRFSILDREFKKKLEARANRMGLTAVQLRVLGELSRAESMGICEGIPEEDIQIFLKASDTQLVRIIIRHKNSRPQSGKLSDYSLSVHMPVHRRLYLPEVQSADRSRWKQPV